MNYTDLIRTEGFENVSRETFARLEIYVAQILKWGRAINLVGDLEEDTIWRRHILDCLQLIEYIKDPHATVADLGSGAGLPGLILTAAGCDRISLIESDQKKSVFLQETARLMGVVVTIENKRIESYSPSEKPQIITARALAPLVHLLQFAQPLLGIYSFCLFPKGKNYAKELDEARRDWNFDLTQFPSKIDPASVILQIKNLQRMVS